MTSIFRNVAQVALGEIIDQYIEKAKYGYFLTEENKEKLLLRLVEFLETSRSLQEAGGRAINASMPPQPSRKERNA